MRCSASGAGLTSHHTILQEPCIAALNAYFQTATSQIASRHDIYVPKAYGTFLSELTADEGGSFCRGRKGRKLMDSLSKRFRTFSDIILAALIAFVGSCC
jgi:hypothetical protein